MTAVILAKKFVVRYTAVIPFSFYIDSKLPIVLFVGQHFSGSLFYTMVLYIGGGANDPSVLRQIKMN